MLDFQALCLPDVNTLKTLLDIVNDLVVIFGIPFAIYKYLEEKDKERLEREREAYDELDDKYIEFERLCLEKPELDIFDVPDANTREKNDKEKKQEMIAFTMLFSIFERAHIAYRNQSDPFRRAQWSGWHEFIGNYCQRANFQAAWKISGTTFETEFQQYMNTCINEVKGVSVPPQFGSSNPEPIK